MQTAKAIFLTLTCAALLGACGLKGKLYLPEQEAASKPAVEKKLAPADEEDKKTATEEEAKKEEHGSK